MGLALHFDPIPPVDTGDDDLRRVALLRPGQGDQPLRPNPRGVAFQHTFAGRTIDGELKRHFRDQTWALGSHRSVRALNVSVRRASGGPLEQAVNAFTDGAQAHPDHLDVSVDG